MAERIEESFCPDDTFRIGKDLAENSKKGDIILLNGDLGVGKTVFTKGFGAGLGIHEPISSPTFTILQIYEDGKMPLYHFDVYRISDVEEMEEIGYEDYFFGEGICLVEWAELIRPLFPPQVTEVLIEKDRQKMEDDIEQGDSYRRITIREWRET